MTDHLPEAVLKGLEDARRNARRLAGRLCVHDGDSVHRILRMWDGGFALAGDTPVLRGHVDIYDGSRHLSQCLVMTSSEEGEERVYEYKWQRAVADTAPVDFERVDPAPKGLLGYFA